MKWNLFMTFLIHQASDLRYVVKNRIRLGHFVVRDHQNRGREKSTRNLSWRGVENFYEKFSSNLSKVSIRFSTSNQFWYKWPMLHLDFGFPSPSETGIINLLYTTCVCLDWSVDNVSIHLRGIWRGYWFLVISGNRLTCWMLSSPVHRIRCFSA